MQIRITGASPINTLDWDNIRHFLAVVESGSVSRAARSLGVNQTTVSRRIWSLEESLGKPLFDRSSGRLVVTPVAERLVASARGMADEANSIERQAMADASELRGRLRVTVADLCTQQLAMPAIESFVAAYPEVDLEVIATRELLDLAAREADVALRSTDEPPPNLVGKRIARLAYAVYGNAELRERVNRQDSVPCITWVGDGHTRPTWIARGFPETRRVYRSTELGIMMQMALSGIGIVQLPCALGDPQPALHRIPCDHVEAGWGLWVLSHVDLRTTARVRMFRDHLVSELNARRDLIRGILPNR